MVSFFPIKIFIRVQYATHMTLLPTMAFWSNLDRANNNSNVAWERYLVWAGNSRTSTTVKCEEDSNSCASDKILYLISSYLQVTCISFLLTHGNSMPPAVVFKCFSPLISYPLFSFPPGSDVFAYSIRWGDCSTCLGDSDPNWKCPAAVAAYNDLLGDPTGTQADIIEVDGGRGESHMTRLPGH